MIGTFQNSVGVGVWWGGGGVPLSDFCKHAARRSSERDGATISVSL